MEVLQETKIGNGRIIKGDCLSVMNELPDDHYILGFTSPPYLNAINYDEHVEKLHGTKERWEREDISYEEYRNFLVDRFKALLRITKPGRTQRCKYRPGLVEEQADRPPISFCQLA